MYNTAPRFSQCNEVEDISFVGPPSYFISEVECSKNKGKVAPFLSSSARFGAFRDDGPSPAHYYSKYRKHRIQGGRSIQNICPRVCIVPTKYMKKPPLENITKPPIFRAKSVIKKSRSSMFRHLYCFSKPEIKETTKQIVLQQRKSLPNFLQFPGETCKVTIKYKGLHWGRYSSKRSSLVTSDTPGPGAYNLIQESVPKKPPPPPPPPVKRRRRCSSISFDPPALLERVSESGKTPGYHFDGNCDLVYKKISHNKSPLGIFGKAQRFTYEINENPAPWDYTPKNESSRKIVDIAPFSSCTPRFKPTETTCVSPASYFLPQNTVKEKLCKNAIPKTRGALVAPFGSTAPRLVPIQLELSEDEEEEDHQDYLIITQVLDTTKKVPEVPDEVPDSREIEKQTESLEDKQKYQIIGTSLVMHETHNVEPPSMNLMDLYNNFKNKKDHRRIKENVGFLSTNYRRSEWIITKSPAHDVDWRGIEDLKINGGAPLMKVPFCKTTEVKQEAPAFYSAHPKYGSSVYKLTHNYRLKAARDLEIAVDNPDSVKILRCFIPKEILNA